MGTIAARDCARVLELSEQVAAAMLIAARQATALRQRGSEVALHPSLAAMQADLAARIPLIEEDRALDGELQQLLKAIRQRDWSLYA